MPIVPTAILFDRSAAVGGRRPDAAAGFAACERAGVGPIAQGRVGAGTGATCGKALGAAGACPGGLGSDSLRAGGGLIVAALVAANPYGNILDWRTGRTLAGARHPGGGFADPVEVLAGQPEADVMRAFGGQNTTLAVVATNARLDKAALTRVARMAHDGLARAIRPLHTPVDGDVVFALSYGSCAADTSAVGALAADVLADAVAAAVREGP